MSLLSTILLPHLERELIALEPQIAAFVLKQVTNLAADVIQWGENKMLHADQKPHVHEGEGHG